jgi:predicted glutamine amidotransferase
MCRLLGYVSQEKQSFNQAVGSDFAEFVTLSSVHCDGWGVATINHDQSVAHVSRAPEAASKSEEFSKTIAASISDGALLHLRWATAGLPVSENNTHPFAYKDISFIHNGATYPPVALESVISPELIPLIQGDTDSERYFYFVISKIKELGFVEGCKAAANYIRSNVDYSSINAMIMNEKEWVVVCEHHPDRAPDWAPADYYELKYKADSHGVLVASTGWNQPGWTILPNHHMLVIDRSTFAVQVVPL